MHDNADTVFYQNRDLQDILHVNQTLLKLKGNLSLKGFEVLGSKAEADFKLLRRYYKELVSGTFNIISSEESLRNLYSSVAKPLHGMVDQTDYIFVEDKVIKTLFPVDLIAKYLEFPYYKYNFWLFDDLMRLKSVLLNIFTQFHLKADTKFHPRLDALSMRTMDPCFRIHVRQANRADKQLQEKYFSSRFHLKTFSTIIAAIHFPSITWRVVESGNYIHLSIVQLINSSLELGLWTYSDINDLLDILLPRLENMIKMEEAVVQEITGKEDILKDRPRFKEYLAYYLLRIRLDSAKILVHIIALINDHALEYSMPWSPKFNGKPKFKRSLEMLFINDTPKSNLVYYLVTHYLLKKDRVEDYFTVDKSVGDSLNWKANFEESTESLANLTMSIFELMVYEQNDMLDTSNHMLDESALSFYQMKVPNCAEYLTEAFYLRMALVDLFDDLKGLDPKDKKTGNMLNSALKRVLSSLQKSLARKAQGSEHEFRHFCLALDLNNLQVILISIATLVNEHINAKSVAIKSDCLILSVKLMWQITISVAGQSNLFSEIGFCLFFRLSKTQPILSVVIASEIFKTNIVVMNKQEALFNMLIKNYQRYIEDLSSLIFRPDGSLKFLKVSSSGIEIAEDESYAIKNTINCMLSIAIYNRCFSQILDLQSKLGSESNKLELKLQRSICPLVSQGILSHFLSTADFLRKSGNSNRIIDFENFEELLSWSTVQRLDMDQMNDLLCEFSASMISIMAKCTSQVFFCTIKKQLMKALIMEDFHSNFGYLVEIKSGPRFRSSLLRLMSNTYIFSHNSLLTKDGMPNAQLTTPLSWSKVIYDSELSIEQVSSFLIDEMDYIVAWHGGMSKLGIQWRECSADVDQYIYGELMAAIYKLVKGYLVTATISHQDNIIVQLKTTTDCLQRLFDRFEVFMGQIKSLFDIDAGQTFAEGLMGFAQLNFMSGELFGNELADSPDLPLMENKPQKVAENEIHKNHHFLPDELICPDLAIMRRICKQITCTIEVMMPEHFNHLISSFNRPTALKRESSKLNELFKESEYIKHRKHDAPFEQDDKLKITKTLASKDASDFEKYQALVFTYRIKKFEWLNYDHEDNSLYRFLNEHKESSLSLMKYLVAYFTRSMVYHPSLAINYFEKAEIELEASFIMRRVLETPTCLSLITFIDRACKMVTMFRDSFFESLVENKDKDDANGRLIVIILTLYRNLLCFNFLKTFHDNTYSRLVAIYDLVNDVLINFSDKNNKKFKTHCLDLSQWPLIGSTSLPDMLMTFLECQLTFMEITFVRKTPTISMVERPEKYTLIISLLQLIAEIASGPHIETQAKIYKRCMESLTAVVFRIVEDVNSDFYQLKWEALSYFQALTEPMNNTVDSRTRIYDLVSERLISIEEAKKNVVNCVCNHIRPNAIEEMIVVLVKKLNIYIKFMHDSEFKVKLIADIRETLLLRRQDIIEAKIQTISTGTTFVNEGKLADLYDIKDSSIEVIDRKIKEIEIKLAKLSSFENTVSYFENKESVILDEMEKLVIVQDYEKLIENYRKYEEFNNHMLMRICITAQGVLMNLVNISKTFKANTINVMAAMYSYYEQKVPKDRLSGVDTTSIKLRIGEEVPDHLVVLMFITQITVRIEVIVPSTKALVIQYFQLHPKCLFLTDDTKNGFIETSEPTAMISEITDKHQEFMIEMESNEKGYKRSRLLYYLTMHDSITIHRYIMWSFGLFINVLFLYDNTKIHSIEDIDFRTFGDRTFDVLSIIIGIYAFILLIMWGSVRYLELVAIERFKRSQLYGVKKYTLKEYFNVYINNTILMKSTPMQALIHLLLSILSIFYSKTFFTLHPILIVLLSNTASYVVRSITTHIKQLLVTLLLALFTIYSYSYLTYIFYADDFSIESNVYSPLCGSLATCFLHSINLGFRNGGGIGDSLELYTNIKGDSKMVSKFFFDLTFFMLINVISLNIIFGIIIDTFASMRDEDDRRRKF